MSIVSIWRDSPSEVKWTSLGGFILGIGGILIMLPSVMDRWGMSSSALQETDGVVIAVQFVICAFIAFASWGFLVRMPWARLSLEIVAWIALINIIGFEVIWFGLILLNWGKYSVNMSALSPHLSPEINFFVDILFGLSVLLLNVAALRALRSSTAKKYVAT